MSKRPVGRPRTYNKKEIKELLKKFEIYIENTDIPILVEFAYKNGITRASLYDYPEFSTLKERCLLKKEAQLETLALFNVVNPTMAVFSLKQMGWSDKSKEEKKDDAEKLKAFVNGVFGVKTDGD